MSTPTTVSSTLEWAKDYIKFEIGEGRLNEDCIQGKTDKEIIDFANAMEARVQAEYDRQKEEGI